MSVRNSVRRRDLVANCIFCNAPNPTSEEHILPRWIYRALEKYGIVHNPLMDYVHITSHGDLTDYLQVQADDATTPILCDDCNNHWGSDLQTGISKLLKPFIIGEWLELNDAQRVKLVQWFTSYLMVRETLHDNHQVHSLQQRIDFRSNGAIPNTLNLWMAPIEIPSIQSVHRSIRDRFAYPRNYGPDIYICVQAIGKVVFVAFGADPSGANGYLTDNFKAIFKCLQQHNFIPLQIFSPTGIYKFPKSKTPYTPSEETQYLCDHVQQALFDPYLWLQKYSFQL